MAKKRSNTTFATSIKRLVGNKNTVTILGVLACIITLIVGYNIRVKNAISPISIPYAKQSIPARTLITNNMVGRIKVSSNYVNESSNLAKSMGEVVNKYVSYKSNIPKGSLFYKDMLKEAEEMPDFAFSNMEDGYTIFNLDVSVDETYANEIRAGDYIDLYMSARDVNNNNMFMLGCLIESIRVLQVKDAKGNNIVKNTLAYGKPSELVFSVKDDMYKLLADATFIKGADVKIFPIIRNHDYTLAENETRVSSEQLQTFILDHTETLN